MDLPSAWPTAGANPRLWGGGSTYKVIPWEALPSLAGPLDGSFRWLAAAPLPPEGRMRYEYQRGDEVQELLHERVAEADRAGLTVPSAFVAFMTDETLFGRVPSCTACYWDVAGRLVSIPGRDRSERLLRFMNDQQACVLWYLLLEPDG